MENKELPDSGMSLPLFRSPLGASFIRTAIVGLVIVTAMHTSGCRTNKRVAQAQATHQADGLTFGANQNDATGYNGFQWGTPIESFLKAQSIATEPQTNSRPRTTVPDCPSGSQQQRDPVDGNPYISYVCQLSDNSGDKRMCNEWEGNEWSTDITIPCGSRAGIAVVYTGPLTCPISQQVYLLDKSAGTISKNITCLPPGWERISFDGGATCPRGSVPGSPVVFEEDACYGPQPQAPQPELSAEFLHAGNEDDRQDNHELSKVFDVPDSEHGGGMLKYMATDFSLIPQSFQSIAKDDSEYIFYKGRLAMVYSKLDVHHKDQLVAGLDGKYQRVGTSTSGWTERTLDEGPQDSTDIEAILFKRGSTNTRIYLINRTDHEAGVGVKVLSLHVLYIPTSFMWEIQQDMHQLASAHQAAAVAAAQQSAKPDIDKLQ
jgi:hypothetical protein